jgi:hypothetical protein
MRHDDGRGRLLGVDLVLLGERDADLLGVQEREERALVGEIGAGGIAEGVAVAAIACWSSASMSRASSAAKPSSARMRLCGDIVLLESRLMPLRSSALPESPVKRPSRNTVVLRKVTPSGSSMRRRLVPFPDSRVTRASIGHRRLPPRRSQLRGSVTTYQAARHPR